MHELLHRGDAGRHLGVPPPLVARWVAAPVVARVEQHPPARDRHDGDAHAPHPVKLAKLSRPRLHDVLPRTRLFGLLDEAVQRAVVWLAAQPGAGKTTLVASYLQARRRPVLWYQLDRGDSDAASFVYHLRLAVEVAEAGRAAQQPLPLLTPEYLRDLPGFARRLFRELFARLPSDAVLVLDNFQEVPEDSAFHRVMAEAMQQVPEGIAVVVLSRGEPPSAYAPLLAADAIALLDGADLELTLDETKAIALRRGIDDTDAVAGLHARSHGWAAGLTLLLTRTRRAGAAAHRDDDADSLQHVFGYFAQRVFDGAGAEQRRVLMQLALLPFITPAIAEQLTGSAEAPRLIEHHYRRHLFTDRRRVAADDGGAPAGHVFQFHALFRTFLLHQARATWSADELRDTTCRAARLLDAAGHWEPALELFADAGDWQAYGRAMAEHVEALLEQGRRQTVIDWLARMPEPSRQRDPWLGYWEARALMQTAPERALAVFDAGYRRFLDAGDAAGQLACGAGAVQTLWYARLGWSEIAPWVDRLEPLIDAGVELPSRAVELMTTSSLHAALSFCRPAHPAIPGMALELLSLIDDAAIDWNLRLATATHLMTYFRNAAEHALAARLVAKVDPAVERLPSSALNRAFWFIFRAIHDLRQADDDAAAAKFRRAEELARQEGLANAEFSAMQFHAYLDLLFRRADDVQARLARLEAHPARGHPDAEVNLCVIRALLAQQRGDRQAALREAERMLEVVERIGAAFFRAVFPPLMASVFADAGQPERALAIIAATRELARGSYVEAMEAQLLLDEAYVALVQGDAQRLRGKLAQGFALAAADPARASYAHRTFTRKPVLLVEALKAGIEVEFVRRMIRLWRVAPPDEDVAAWPWPVKVRTLGGFEVLVHDAPIEFGRKAPKKTLALLKALVARGGSASDAALIDTFWPDEEGDAAARSLAATVHRLRVLLGVGDAVVQQGGQLSLDRSRVWVDAWAFERALAAERDASDALALYRGAFLSEEEGEGWPVPMRERLRGKFVQAVSRHAGRLEAEHRDEEALAWYLRGLDADSVVEPFYQGLMRCYHRLDRLPEAASAYRRLKQTLSVILNLPPSASTEKLYQSLRLQG